MVYLTSIKGQSYFFQKFRRGKCIKIKKHDNYFYIHLEKADEFGVSITLGTDEWETLTRIMKNVKEIQQELNKKVGYSFHIYFFRMEKMFKDFGIDN
jgi:hypothetical protein